MSRKRPRPANYHGVQRARRGRGEWTIYQREDGTWCGQGSYGYDAEGRRIRPTLYAPTKRELLTKIEEYKRKMGENVPVKTNNITVKEHFERWLHSKRHSIARSTYLAYSAKTHNHIIRYMGHMRVRDLTHHTLNRFYSDDLPGHDLSPRYMYDIASILRMGLWDAAEDGLISRDVIEKAEHPPKAKSIPRHLTPGEVDVFLEAAKGQRMEHAFTVGIHTGLRPGELLGMSWPEIDWERRLYTVGQAVHEDEGVLTMDRLKTDASYRTIPLSDVVIDALEQQQRKQIEEQLISPSWQNEFDLVFTNTEGGMMSRSNFLRRDLRTVLSRAALIRMARRYRIDPDIVLSNYDGSRIIRAGDQIQLGGKTLVVSRSDVLDRVTTHSLRHTHASILIHMGVDIKIVSRVLGHTNVRFTYDTYVHLMPGDEDKAADAMDRFAASRLENDPTRDSD